ncbi:YgaP family membrane protein [Nitrospira sp. Kam-Ns4a]
MTCNVGGVERPIRIVFGILLVSLGAFGGLPAGAALGAYIVGAIALVTGAVGLCPLWTLLGINTCATKPSGKR